ncbi:tyrosine-type recombinase/integrase [Chitinimonas naiadis]
MTKKLFHLMNNVDISHDALYNSIGNVYSVRRELVLATFAVSWPDGTPCSLVEIYLISRFRSGATVREDGGSLRAIVSKLTHLIRYCWDAKRDFWELDDGHIYQFVVNLMEEVRPAEPMIRVRDNNTVRNIVAAAVEFLLWLQIEMLPGVNLIGVGSSYRIKLVERRVLNARNNKYNISLVYPRLPPRDTKEPKHPISNERRNLLWQAVGKLAGTNLVMPGWSKGVDNSRLLLRYLKERRELLLELLEATGARPGELSRLSVSDNEDCYKNQELVLTTLKRRRDVKRVIKLQSGVAMRLTVFINKNRADLLGEIKKRTKNLDSKDFVFLSISGSPMSERSMVSEFCRISKLAGFSEYQSCMSMFRHRYITKQVAIHLGIYLGENNKVKELMSDGDYRSILKRVAATTGHGSELSLLNYLDLAWDELGALGQVSSAVAIDASIRSAVTQVISLTESLNVLADKKSGDHAMETLEVLRRLQLEIQSALNESRG